MTGIRPDIIYAEILLVSDKKIFMTVNCDRYFYSK